MYLDFFGILFVMFVGLFIKIDGLNIVRKEYRFISQKWENLQGLVATQKKGKTAILVTSMYMIMQVCYTNFLQYMNSTIIKVGKNKYEVAYVINGKIYKMLVSPQRGPAPVLHIHNEKHEDMTGKILPFMGPKYNWHGGSNTFTPKFFECQSLTFQLSDGCEHTYTGDTHININ